MSYQCCYCSIPLNRESRTGRHPRRFTIEHIIPKNKGGASCKKNLTPCCYTCNSLRSSKDLHEFKQEVLNIKEHPVLSRYDLEQMPKNIDLMIAYVRQHGNELYAVKPEQDKRDYVYGDLSQYEHRYYY